MNDNHEFKSLNKYKLFTDLIELIYSNDKKILDVGAGHGTTSCLLASKGYDVTSMDLFSLSTKKRLNSNNIKVLNEFFSLESNVNNYDLIVGLHCCGATELIIRSSIINNKDFLVTLCETRNDILDNKVINTRDEYVNYLLSLDSNICRYDLPIYVDSECWGITLYLKKDNI